MTPLTNPQPDAQLPQRNERFARVFDWYSQRLLRKSFSRTLLHIDGQPPDASLTRGKPLLVYMNHPSWWDPIIAMVLGNQFFSDYQAFAPIDAEALEQYQFFRKLGLFGIDQRNDPHVQRQAVKQFLKLAGQVLQQQNHLLCVTAEGTFRDVRQRPVQLRPGVAHLIRKHRDIIVLPLVVEYTFWTEKQPELLIRFGPPTPGSEYPDRPGDIQSRLEADLAEQLDQLAAASLNRDPAQFTPLLMGRSGVGGIYDLYRSLRAKLAGKDFDPRHESVTKS